MEHSQKCIDSSLGKICDLVGIVEIYRQYDKDIEDMGKICETFCGDKVGKWCGRATIG
eukprot:Pgem_evm2s8938